MTNESLHKEFLRSKGICIDTRKKVEGKLFFALKGENFDGKRFVPEALELGCRLAITEDRKLEGSPGVICVPSVLETLQQLAHFHRIKVSPRVMAITGSNGKTTTKELICAILSRRYRVLATAGNLNNHIGVPLTLLSLKDEEIAVIEMGANHAGEIGKLSEIAVPELGLITNVGKAHLEGFGTLEGVKEAKGELYDFLASHNGLALIDGSDSLLLNKAEDSGVDSLVIGRGRDIGISGHILDQSPFLELELSLDGQGYRLGTRMVGAYNLQNILLAAATGIHFEVPADTIMDAISEYKPDNQRSQLIKGGRNRIILDAYNANPTSMREAISALQEYANPPLMLILGDMAELGETSMEEHRDLVKWITKSTIDRIILAGPIFAALSKSSSRIAVYEDISQLKKALRMEKPSGYHILMKGSRIMALEQLTPYLVE